MKEPIGQAVAVVVVVVVGSLGDRAVVDSEEGSLDDRIEMEVEVEEEESLGERREVVVGL